MKLKFNQDLIRTLSNPDITPLVKVVIRNEYERQRKLHRGGNKKGYKWPIKEKQ